MRVLMYQSGLGPLIVKGQKTTTIRGFTVLKNGKTGGGAKCKPGDVLSHREWTGAAYRSKQRELCQTVCKSVQSITIGPFGIIYVDDSKLQDPQSQQVANSDGFPDLEPLLIYFRKTHGLPFYGEIIRWDPPQ